MQTADSVGRPGPGRAGLFAVLLPPLALGAALAVSFYSARPSSPRPESPEGQTVSPPTGLDRRILERSRLAREVAEGRLGLMEAAGRNLEISRASADFPWAAFRGRYPGMSDEEAHCRSLIEDASDGNPALRARLETELKRNLRGGRLKLPPPPTR
jgi:hypothetical protein